MPLTAALMRRSRAFRAVSRHVPSLIRHTTPAKLQNALRVEMELKLRRVKLRGWPYIFFIDPVNICNLRCPLCPTGANGLKREAKMMGIDLFKRIVDQIAPYAYQIRLYNWGEPLLNPDIFDMLAYARDKNIGTIISSNLMRMRLEHVERLIEAGLEYLTLSIDGATQDVYSKYRVRGDLQLVLDNLKMLIDRKKALKSALPFIEWQFIVMKHNEHQIDAVRQLADASGVDLLRLIPVGLPFDTPNASELCQQWMPDDARYRDKVDRVDAGQPDNRSPACFYLYRSMTINPDGKVSPCCIVYDSKYDFGDASQDSIERIWNNEHYLSARSLFARKGASATWTVCQKCQRFVGARERAPG